MIIRKAGLSAQELRQVLIDIYRGAIHEGGGARYSIEVVRIDKEQSAEPMTEEEESYTALWERHQGLISRIDIEAVNHPHIEPVRTVTVLDTKEYLEHITGRVEA